VHWEKPVGAVVLAWLILELRILSDEQFPTAQSCTLGMIDVKALYYPLTRKRTPGVPRRQTENSEEVG
jgi:hypothetical protein